MFGRGTGGEGGDGVVVEDWDEGGGRERETEDREGACSG